MARTTLGWMLAGLLALTGTASAQEWPTRPVTMVVAYAAGGPVDTIGRILAAGLSGVLGQQVIVENIGGAGGMTGAHRVVKAAPDGYTFLLGGLSNLAQNQVLYKNPLYNAATDFALVGLVTDSARVLITRKDFPASTLPEFIAYAKANQERLQYGSAGVGSGVHVCSLLLDTFMGTKIIHVPYRGAAVAMQDLLAGRLDYIAEQISTALPQIRAGNVKAIATLGPERAPGLPDLPTAPEQGLANFDCGAWSAFAFPKGTPEPIVGRLNKAASEVIDNPAIRERLATVGVTVIPAERRSPEFLARFIPAEIEKWTAPIRASGVAAE